jgi:4-amino-4-deoxy-L-arabinose transferase-like glycosyltransferase
MLEKERDLSVPLILILAVSLAVRIALMTNSSLIIENEGGEYAAIAENLLAGKGYVGLGSTGKPQLLFPPLYPFAIALISMLTTVNTELAARIISLVMGLGLVFVIFKLGTFMYGRSVGLISATLVGLHPLLVRLSISVQSEATYIALVFAGVYCSIKSIDGLKIRWLLGAGLCLGLAYLTRPEAVLLVLLLSGYLCVVSYVTSHQWRTILARIPLVVVVFAVLASPYVFFLHRHTGQIRIEGKSPVNYVIGQRVMSGMGVQEATFGVGDDLREFGVGMENINGYIINPGKVDLSAMIPYVARAAKYQLKNIVSTVTNSGSFGRGLLFATVILGLFCSAWDADRTKREACLLLVFGGVSASLFSLQHFQERYVVILLPFMLLWGGQGIDELTRWARHTWSLVGTKDRAATKHRLPILQLLLIALLLLSPAIIDVTAHCDDYRSSNSGCVLTKRAGLWLREQPPENKVIMDAGTAIPYYARAEFIGLPYSSSTTAIKYILRKQPDFVVLRGTMREDRPYLEEWLKAEVLGPHFRLVYEAGNTLDDKIKIYKAH